MLPVLYHLGGSYVTLDKVSGLCYTDGMLQLLAGIIVVGIGLSLLAEVGGFLLGTSDIPTNPKPRDWHDRY